MNYTLVILGIILILVIYILYKVISEKGKVVTNKVDLNENNGTISYDRLTSPKSKRYCFSLWVYIGTPPSSGDKTLFDVKDQAATPINHFKLVITTDAKLKYSLYETGGANAITKEITTNFPMQRWVYLIFSLDNKVVDLYMDGKMIRSHQINEDLQGTDETYRVSYGEKYDAFLAKFERLPAPMDPALAWNKYMQGNGGNYFSRLFSSYGATFTLKKDDLDVKQFNLF